MFDRDTNLFLSGLPRLPLFLRLGLFHSLVVRHRDTSSSCLYRGLRDMHWIEVESPGFDFHLRLIEVLNEIRPDEPRKVEVLRKLIAVP